MVCSGARVVSSCGRCIRRRDSRWRCVQGNEAVHEEKRERVAREDVEMGMAMLTPPNPLLQLTARDAPRLFKLIITHNFRELLKK